MSNGKILSVNVRGIAPEATFNGLLCSVAIGRQSGLSSGYEFRDSLELDDTTLFDAPRGAENSSYTIAPTLKQLDPTTVLSSALTIGRRDSPLLRTGRTSAHREVEMISGISAIFGEWWYKLCHLANMARGAEKIEGTSLDTPIMKGFETKSSSGKIAAFYAAVGDLQDYGFNLQENPSVDEVMTAVMMELKPIIGALDQTSFNLAISGLKASMGSTTIPQTGEAVELVSTSTWNSFMAAPWRRLMISPHARNKMIRVLASRIPSAVRTSVGSEEAFLLVEGDDAVVIPAHCTTESTGDACIDKIGAEIDSVRLGGLTQDRYSGATSMTALHTDQYFLNGDLIEAILKGAISLVDESLLSVFPAMPVLGTYDGKDILMFDYDTIGTGGMCSTSPVASTVVNWISGRDLFIEDSGYDAFGTMTSGKFTAREVWHHILPNGVMQMNDPAYCVVKNWKAVLQMMLDSITTDARFLLGTNPASSRADRLKRDLKEESTTITDGGSVMAEIATYSQLDGIVTSISASFNPNKVDKPAQQGPVLTDLATGVGPQEVATMSTFTRPDPSKEQHFIDLFGGEIQGPKNAQLSSLHVGEAEGKKSPTPLLQKNLPSSKLFGSDNPARDLAEYLQSLPRTLDGSRVLNTVSAPEDHTGITTSKLNNYRYGTGGQAIVPAAGPNFGDSDYGGYVNIHPGTGFKRGFAQERGHGGTFDRGLALNVSTTDRMKYYQRRADTSAAVTHALSSGVSVGVVPLTLGCTQTTRYGGELAGSGTVVPTQAGPRSQWITNWGETGLIGNSNYEMFGLVTGIVTLNPGQTSPVSIPNGWISFTDLIRMEPINTLTVTGEVSLNGPYAAGQFPGLTLSENRAIGVVIQEDFATQSNVVETGEGLVGAVTIVQPYADRADYVSRQLALDFDDMAHNGNGLGGLLGADDHLFKPDGDVLGNYWGDISVANAFSSGRRLVYLAPWRRTFGVNNVSRRNVINLTTGHGLDHTNDCTVGCTVFDAGRQGGEPTTVQLFDGYNLAPVNGINVVKVQGSGVCKLGSMDYEPFGVLQWVMDTIRLMSDMIVRTPQMAPGLADGPYDFSRSDLSAKRSILDDVTVEVPSIGVGGSNSKDGWLETSGTKIPNETNPINPWFMKTPGVHGNGRPRAVEVQARNPEGEVALTNPWVRQSAGERGYEVIELNPKDTRAATVGMLGGLAKVHSDLSVGLNAHNFLVLNERGS